MERIEGECPEQQTHIENLPDDIHLSIVRSGVREVALIKTEQTSNVKINTAPRASLNGIGGLQTAGRDRSRSTWFTGRRLFYWV